MSEERKIILIPHIATKEEERELTFKQSLEGYKLQRKLVDYVKKESCYVFVKTKSKFGG